ncbi:ero1-like protein precursor fumarate reductase, partial [Chrysochromulina tobinii]
MLAAFAALVLAASPFSPFDVLPSGPLADTQCNLETVEAANEHQLHTLLAELSTAPFFRLINVNMDGKCQYWGGPEEEEHVCVSKAEDTAEPLCTLGTDNSASDPFGAAATGGGGSPFSSSMSPPREQSSVPTDPVDVTITPEEHAYVGTIAEDCNDETLPSFWLDMCSAIPTNASDYVNLQLNEESYTGYNGSHVWAAIYNENCLVRTGSDQNICLEERVLYRLLSGMHAATNTHVARFYHPPSKRKNRTDWEPDLAYFARQFDGHPERLKNLHFAFVVLLRAVRRASPFLSTLKEVGGMMDATALVRRFLDTAILKSCSAVFEAFDEGLLFREEQASWWSLKKQFKGVFHNVSRVIDCVSCQKCRLHAKVTMLGYGTALKLLLLPPELFPTSVSRDEVAALFNTLHKFSSAITHVKELTELRYARYYAADG